MVKIIGVRFRNVGKIYYFNPKSFQMKPGDHVIVETARGVEYGTVVLGPKEVDDRQVVQPLKDVIRMATQKDDAKEESNRKKEKEAYQVCVKKIRAHQLEMKLIDVEYTFDNNKILFYFTADGRIDFRELVKDLAAIFKTRIELRQIGVRDETKILGGIGICGRPLCCHTYLSEFAPVSIKMAKEQNLSLNPTKISGVCGRLMCCLKNEQETYEYLNKQLPNIGDQVMTPEGIKGEVQSVNVLRQLVKVIMDVNDEKEIREYKVEELKIPFQRMLQEREDEAFQRRAEDDEGIGIMTGEKDEYPLKENERLDDLQNGYHIIQNTRDFCYGIDAVLLSDFARVKKGEQALDLGTGNGNYSYSVKSKDAGRAFYRSGDSGAECRDECGQGAVWCIIIWRMRLPSEREISKKPLPSLAGLLFR